MLKLSKKTEYALMAVKYIAVNNGGNCITAKEISSSYKISYELVSKILQQLTKFNLVQSFQGVKGGYTLPRSPNEITLIEILKAVEPNYYITDCMSESGSSEDCRHFDCCMIRNPLMKIQKQIENIFKQTTIKEII